MRRKDDRAMIDGDAAWPVLLSPLPARGFAALIATAAAVGIALDYGAVAAAHGWLPALWVVAAYFTITTNALLVVLFGGIALGAWPARPWPVAGATLAIVLVGVIYALLLQGLRELTGNSIIANFLMHQLTPVLAPLFWLLAVPKGRLRWRDPLLWALYPLVYLAYALARGAVTGIYPYPFIDVGELGMARVVFNAIAIAAGFVVAGGLLVWLDRRQGGQRNRATS